MHIARAMKKRTAQLLVLTMFVLMPQICLADHLVISEVLYDPTGTETGGEAVEIFNPTGSAVDISGYTIRTESSAADAAIPEGTVLEAGQWYLIADTGWSTSKDDPSWPDADHEEPISMYNTDSGIALVAANGTILDAVGWGDPLGIGDGLHEGLPAAYTGAGESLQRAGPDTDDNSVDFTSSIPDLKNSAHSEPQPEGTDISVGVEILSSAPEIGNIEILIDDDTEPGIQVIPAPGDVKQVPIQATVSDADGMISSVIALVAGTRIELSETTTLNFTTSTYTGSLPMQFYRAAGTYDVMIIASDTASNASANATFEYLSMAAISIDASSLQFADASLGSTAVLNGDYALSTADAPTVRNIGNTPLDFGMYGTDLTDGEKSIAVGNMRYSFDNDFDGTLSGQLGKTMQMLGLGLTNGEDSVTSLGFSLDIPSDTQNGNYTGSVTVVAVSSE